MEVVPDVRVIVTSGVRIGASGQRRLGVPGDAVAEGPGVSRRAEANSERRRRDVDGQRELRETRPRCCPRRRRR